MCSSTKKTLLWIFAFFAFVVLSSGGGNHSETKKQRRKKNLRKHAEVAPEDMVSKLQDINHKKELNEKYAKLNDFHANFDDGEDASLNDGVLQDDEKLDNEVERVFQGVGMAEEDEIDSNSSMLTTAVKTVEDSVRSYLGNLFGLGDEDDDDDDDDFTSQSGDVNVKLTEDQLNIIAQKISERLGQDVQDDFRKKADNVKEGKIRYIVHCSRFPSWNQLFTTTLVFWWAESEKEIEIYKVVEEDRRSNMNTHDVRS